MHAKLIRNVAFALCFVTFGIVAAFGQAVLTAGSSPIQATDIGYAEPTGNISFVIVSGVSVSATLQIKYSAPITNNDVSEISLNGVGILAASRLALDYTTNSLLVDVQGGGTTGDLIVISGVRVALAGHNPSVVTASVTSLTPEGNSVVAGQTNLVVIGEILQPFSVDEGVTPLVYQRGVENVAASTFVIHETYPTAFVSSAPGVGRIRVVPFPSIPDGIHLTFPATAVSGAGGMFSTFSGFNETVPREDGSTDVFYQFAEDPASQIDREAFPFEVVLTGNPATSGQIQFQVELLPIGREFPDAEFPSTDIPRYAERLVPEEGDLVGGSTELFVPFEIKSEDTYTGIALTNPNDFKVRATLTAYDINGQIIAGTGITNPAEIELPRSGQYAALASAIFGDGFNASSLGTIRILGKGPKLQGFYLTGDNSGPKLDGGTANVAAADLWQLPVVFRQGNDPFNTLEFYNPGTTDTTVTLSLMDVNGNEIATQSQPVPAGGTFSGDLQQVFNRSLGTFQGGYVEGDSPLPLIVRESFGNSLESNVLSVQPVSPLLSFSIPHFASGDQYLTELTLVNTDHFSLAEITLTLLDNNAAPISSPVTVQIQPAAQLIRTVSSLFPNLGSGLVTGSIKVDVKPTYRGPFLSVPALTGAVRFANVDGSASATLPLLLTPSRDFVYSHIAQTQGWFTGLAVLNATGVAADFTIDVFDQDGVLTGTYSSQLQPNERFAKLLYQLVPESEGQSGGYIRISSTADLISFALFGTIDLKSLSAIPAQSIQ